MALDLHPGEHVIFDGHPSWRGTLSFYIKGIVASALGAVIAALVTVIAGDFALGVVIAVFVVLAALTLLVGFVKRVSTTYTITNQRLTIQHGILAKHMQQTRVERVQNVNTNQSVVDRILRVGQVEFETAGSDDADFRFAGVANPDAVVRAVDAAHREREHARESRPDQGL